MSRLVVLFTGAVRRLSDTSPTVTACRVSVMTFAATH
jgi:hypothetical protein